MLDAVYERTAAQIAAALEMPLNQTDLAVQDTDVVISALEEFSIDPRWASLTV